MATHKTKSQMPITQWSLIGRAGAADANTRQEAVAQIVVMYAPPLESLLRSTYRIAIEDAKDILQGFITERILEKAILSKADPSRGRFRNFLIKSLANFASTWLKQRRSRTIRQKEWCEAIELDAAGESPQRRFVREWGRQVLRQAMDGMRRECNKKGRTDIWELFEARVLLPALDDAPPAPYEEVVQRLGLPAPRGAVNLLVTGIRMYKRHLRAEIGRYASTPEQIEEELRDLKQAFE